jgi:heme/copper-type cytochrome/quinol oxidase subunit 2
MLVLGAIVYSVAKFKHADANAGVARRHPRSRELLWALLPMAIVVAAAAPAVRDAEPQLARKHLAPETLVAHAEPATALSGAMESLSGN